MINNALYQNKRPPPDLEAVYIFNLTLQGKKSLPGVPGSPLELLHPRCNNSGIGMVGDTIVGLSRFGTLARWVAPVGIFGF